MKKNQNTTSRLIAMPKRKLLSPDQSGINLTRKFDDKYMSCDGTVPGLPVTQTCLKTKFKNAQK